MNENDTLESPIEEAFKSIEGTAPDTSMQLFNNDKKNLDTKTDVVYPEDVMISSLRFADSVLEEHGIGEVFDGFINNLLGIRISLDRKSRIEFVAVNTKSMANIQVPAEFNKIEEARK